MIALGMTGLAVIALMGEGNLPACRDGSCHDRSCRDSSCIYIIIGFFIFYFIDVNVQKWRPLKEVIMFARPVLPQNFPYSGTLGSLKRLWIPQSYQKITHFLQSSPVCRK